MSGGGVGHADGAGRGMVSLTATAGEGKLDDRVVSWAEVWERREGGNVWTVLDGVVWDISGFAARHPGGAAPVRAAAGRDATAEFARVHPGDLPLRALGEARRVGRIEAVPEPTRPRSLTSQTSSSSAGSSSSSSTTSTAAGGDDAPLPPLESMLNVFDFEAAARRVLPADAWAYYNSGADDELSLRENHAAFQRVWLVPRVLVDVAAVDTRSQILGVGSAMPLYFTATAMAKLGHPEGEVAIMRAAQQAGLPYMIPTLASCTANEMLSARAEGQQCFAQLYVNPDRQKTVDYVRTLGRAGGVRALFVTVDAPQLGRREKDLRQKFVAAGPADAADASDATPQPSRTAVPRQMDRGRGVTRGISSFIDPSLSWKDLPGLRSVVDEHSGGGGGGGGGGGQMKLILKGVQCAEDAVLALRAGVDGIVLSNHGGRQLDTSRSGLEVLPEVMAALSREPGYSRDRFPVYVDGGVRRGSDIFKALALGASAVGIGRPVLYALAAHGAEGVAAMAAGLRDELEMVMRLAGTPTIGDIGPSYVRMDGLRAHVTTVPRDNLAETAYEPLRPAQSPSPPRAKL